MPYKLLQTCFVKIIDALFPSTAAIDYELFIFFYVFYYLNTM